MKTLNILLLLFISPVIAFSQEADSVKSDFPEAGRCFYVMLAKARTPKNDTWMHTTNVYADKPITIPYKSGEKCADFEKPLKDQFVDSIKVKFGNEFQVAKSSIVLWEQSSFATATQVLKQDQSANKAKFRIKTLAFKYIRSKE